MRNPFKRKPKESSPEMSSLAARVLRMKATGDQHYDELLGLAKALAGSVLSQDETPGQ